MKGGLLMKEEDTPMQNVAKARAKGPKTRGRNTDKAYVNTIKAIPNLQNALVWLAFTTAISSSCSKCKSVDSYYFLPTNIYTLICKKCNHTVRLEGLPTSDVVKLSRVLFYYRSTGASLSKIADIFNIQRSDVLKYIQWALHKHVDKEAEWFNFYNRCNLIIGEAVDLRKSISDATFKYAHILSNLDDSSCN